MQAGWGLQGLGFRWAGGPGTTLGAAGLASGERMQEEAGPLFQEADRGWSSGLLHGRGSGCCHHGAGHIVEGGDAG